MSGVTTAYGTTVGSLTWKEGNALGVWHLGSKNGDNLGSYAAVVAADKSLASERFTALTGLPPPLGWTLVCDNLQSFFDLALAFIWPLISCQEGCLVIPDDLKTRVQFYQLMCNVIELT